MKIPRDSVGRYVEIVWRDPCSNGKRMAVTRAPKGIAALATWHERGVLDDITDGVVRVVHSVAFDPPSDPQPEAEIVATWIPETLIESLTVFEAVRLDRTPVPSVKPDP